MTLDLLLIGLAIALEPLPVSAYILILASEGGVRKATGFLLGWVLTLVGVVVLVLTVTGGKPLQPRSAPSTASLLLRVVLGVALLVSAWHKRAQRERPRAEPSCWLARLDRLNFSTAMVFGFLLQPWPLVAAGAATVTEADLSRPATLLALVSFCVLASASYVTMQVYALASPRSARARLDGLNSWIATHRDQVVVLVSVVIGIWLVSVSTYQLASR